SLRSLRVAVSEPSPGLPQSVAVRYLDGTPTTACDSERGRMEPQTPWMVAGAEPGYWDTETRNSEGHRHVDVADLETL
ncbi:1A31 protein, partial [Menura novaehollandiae]|nr:1A31 protein [Menura novaehollandiae]